VLERTLGMFSDRMDWWA